MTASSSHDDLSGTQAWYQATFEHAAVGIAHVALDGRFLTVNARFCAITGYPRDVLLNSSFQRITHPADLAQDEHNIAELLAGRIEHYALEKRYLHADGSTVWVHLTVGLVRRDDGAPGHFISVIDDITAHKAAEQALAAQQRQARFMLDLSERLRELSDPQAIMDAATAALGAYLAVAQVGFGEIDEAQTHVTVHRDWNDGRIPSVVGTWRLNDFGPAFFEDLKAGHTIAIPDVRHDARTNAPAVLAAYAGISTRSILDVPLVKHGRMVALLFVIHCEPRPWTSDEVTLVEQTCERLWAVVERARAEAALRESREQLEMALQAARMGVFDWDLAIDRIELTDESVDLLGLLPDNRLPTSEEVFKIVHPDDVQRHRTAFLEACEHGNEWHSEYGSSARATARSSGSRSAAGGWWTP
jgi:PAS domain S-box-containing protein